MVPRPPLPVVLCWRMHEHVESWVHLRAVGEWFDIAQALESVPQAAAVLGISGLLLDQLADLNLQLTRCLRTGRLPDAVLLAGLASPEPLASPDSRAALVDACRRVLAEGPIAAYPALARLDADVRSVARDGRANWSESLARDYLVWTHLAYLSAALRTGDPRVASLAGRPGNFTAADARELAAAMADAIASLTPRWRRMLGNGQVEIAAQAYSGAPIDSWLGARQTPDYPGGDDRARWQIARTLQSMVGAFGVRPRGFLSGPCESGPVLAELLESFGLVWSAGLCPVRNALNPALAEALNAASPPPYVLASWPQPATRSFGAPDALAVMTADLRTLHERRDVSLTTSAGLPQGELPTLALASRKRRRAVRRRSTLARRQWLIDAKQTFDQVVVEGNLSDEQQRLAELELARCESADWLEGADGAAFARQLTRLYRVLHEVPPESVARPAAALAA